MKYLYLCPICAALVFVFLKTEKAEKYVPAVILKGLASAVFLTLGLLGNPGGKPADYIVTGLLLGMIADVLLNLRFVFKKVGTPVFLVGILVFLTGHIFYLCALISRCPGFLWYALAGCVLTFFVLKWIFSKITAKKAFKIFGVFYIGAIVIMNCAALGVLIADPCAHTAVYMAGALFFLVSDIVLILNTFGGESRFSLRITNISLYYIGQLLIAASLQLL